MSSLTMRFRGRSQRESLLEQQREVLRVFETPPKKGAFASELDRVLKEVWTTSSLERQLYGETAIIPILKRAREPTFEVDGQALDPLAVAA